jgi:deoxyribonuclease V
MKLAIDVFYQEDAAKIVAAVFNQWPDQAPEKIVVKYKSPIAAYTPGAFYKRELPCLTDIIEDFNLNEVDVIIIDGYVYLDDDGKPGLGAHLYEHLKGAVPVIGIAKTSFHLNIKHVKEVYRGASKQPLYVTAIGTDLFQAAQDIKNMYGEYRMPQILKLIDTETKR